MKNLTRELLVGGTLVVLLGGGGLWAANAGILNGPSPEPTAVIQDETTPSPTPTVTVTPTPVPAVEPVVEAPPAEEAPAEPEYTAGQSGDSVPFVASSDPNNANGGDYIDPGIYCVSGSASGAPPICD